MKKLILITLFLLLSTSKTHAQASRSITISPPTVRVDINPGESLSGILQVRNNGAQGLNFEVGVFDYVVNDTKGTPVILTNSSLTEKFSAASWMNVDSQFFTLLPRTTKAINYYISVPSNARPGGHYASVIYKSDSENGTQPNAKVFAQVGTLFYINVKGTIIENAKVAKFEAKKFQENGPIDLTLEIENLGDLHIKPNGAIMLIDTFGKEIERQNISEHNIFPEKSYLYKNTFGKEFMIGKYTLKLVATYGENNNRPLVKEINVIIFPWKIALTGLLVAIIIALGVIVFAKKEKEND